MGDTYAGDAFVLGERAAGVLASVGLLVGAVVAFFCIFQFLFDKSQSVGFTPR